MSIDKKKIAKEILDMFPKMDVVYITSDGQGFDNGHSANNHQKEVLGKRDLTDEEMPTMFSRTQFLAEIVEKPKVVKLTAEQLVEKINAATSADEVDAIVGSDNRATVTKAAEAKKEELAGAGKAGAEGGKTE